MTVGVTVGVTPCVGDGDGGGGVIVTVGDGVILFVGDGVTVCVGVIVGVTVNVGVTDGVGVTVNVTVGVGVGDAGVKSEASDDSTTLANPAMLAPRLTIRRSSPI